MLKYYISHNFLCKAKKTFNVIWFSLVSSPWQWMHDQIYENAATFIFYIIQLDLVKVTLYFVTEAFLSVLYLLQYPGNWQFKKLSPRIFHYANINLFWKRWLIFIFTVSIEQY